MKCPHCLLGFHSKPAVTQIGSDQRGSWAVYIENCPSCKKAIIFLVVGKWSREAKRFSYVNESRMVNPKGSNRAPCPIEVPTAIAQDYNEACLVLADSAKASAALSRRALQHILRTAGGVKHSDLAKEIQEIIDSGKLPTQLAENIDAIRNIGNFSAHPMKSTSSGEILPVEPHEAEWTLEVLEMLFDFFYVAPAKAKARRDALNAKLVDAAKPPMK